MSIKIFHTSDNHLGMKFAKYPDDIRDKLIDARLGSIRKMVEFANQNAADLFVVAGDLFNSLNIPEKLVKAALDELNRFTGVVLVLPGNHDYYSGNEKLWKNFIDHMSDEVILLNEFKPYDLSEYGHNAVVYPAHCDSKHSKSNNIAWISTQKPDENRINIGIAHGAFEGITLDLEGNYFYMSRAELTSIPMDVWLIGHTHVPYPADGKPSEDRIYNAGTHEPDGMNYRYEGSGFLIEIDENKNINSSRYISGEYRFEDISLKIDSIEDLDSLISMYSNEENANKLLRVKISGMLDRDFYEIKNVKYDKLKSYLAYLDVADDELKIRLTKEDIGDYFIEGSFPHKMLNKLGNDEEALQIAFEMIEDSRRGV